MSSVITVVCAVLAVGLALLWKRQRADDATTSELSREINRLSGDVALLRSDAMQASNEHALAKANSDARFSEIASATSDLGRSLSERTAEQLRQAQLAVKEMEIKLSGVQGDFAAEMRTAIERLQGSFNDLQSTIESNKTAEDRTKKLIEQRLNEEANIVTEQLAAADAQLLTTAARQEQRFVALNSAVKGLEDKLGDEIERERSRLYSYLLNLSTINSSGFLSHRRHLAESAIRDLLAGYVPALGLAYNRRQLAYIAHKVCLLEDKCVGRLATSIETIVVRILAARHLIETQKRLHLLEIGTLFGVGAAALYELNHLLTDDISLTLIDPLTGYYGAGEPDVITGEAVTREALLTNLNRGGIPVNRIRILQGLSQDQTIRDACPKKSFNLLVIDGDHSREGVKRDFENYRDRVRPNGLIIFDDYDVKEWPDIKAYVDEEINGRADVKLIAKGWRTALFRALPETS